VEPITTVKEEACDWERDEDSGMEEPAEKCQKLGDDRQSEERSPAATSQEIASCSDEVLSDSEDERKQCAVAIASIDALVATELRTEDDNAKAANRPKDESRIELLLLARRLVQIHSEGDSQPTPDDLSLATAKAAGKNEHPERETMQEQVKDRLAMQQSPLCLKHASSWLRKASSLLMRSKMAKPWWYIVATTLRRGYSQGLNKAL
jgi:hypothetical protein